MKYGSGTKYQRTAPCIDRPFANFPKRLVNAHRWIFNPVRRGDMFCKHCNRWQSELVTIISRGK